MLVIGISATLIGIGILIYRGYDSIVYGAYKSDPEKREGRICLEAVISLSITLGLIIGLLHYYFSAVRLPQISTDILAFLLPLLSLPPLLFLTYRFFRRILNPISEDKQQDKARIRQEALILLLIPPGLVIGLLYYHYSVVRLPQISTDILAFLPLLSLPPLLFLTYRFLKRIQNPGDDRQQDQTNWEVSILLFLLLAEATLILPFLHGRSDSEAALKDEDRRVQVALRQDSVQPGTRPPKPDRTLFLGTTSSFHFFYECEKALNAGTDSKGQNGPKASAAQHQADAPECEKGRPFIVPTANIASLEFNPENKEIYIPLEGQKHCGPGWEKVATIGPFPIGEHDKLTPKKFESELVTPYQLIHARRSLFEAGTPRQLMLIGRVDITQLNDQKREDYGSNNGLAQARAKWVWEKLVKKLDKPEKDALRERTIFLSAGPLHVGKNVEETNRAKDRSVEVWVCGGAKT